MKSENHSQYFGRLYCDRDVVYAQNHFDHYECNVIDETYHLAYFLKTKQNKMVRNIIFPQCVR